MGNGYRRWYRLTALALCNLVLWVGIAALVGLLLSDQLDVGLETKLRQGQATAIAAWKGLSEGGLGIPTRATVQLGELQPTPTRPGTRQPRPTLGVNWSEPSPSPTDGPDADDPVATPSATSVLTPPAGGEPRPTRTAPPSGPAPDASPPEPSATGVPGSEPSADEPSTAEPPAGQDGSATGEGAVSAAPPPTPEPTPVLLSSPLLLADPEFHSLAGLNAEMARSAPGRVVQIRYQEAMLNQEIATLCENNPDLPFRNVHADLKRNQVVLTGEITILSFQVQAMVTGTVVARDCRPQIEIESITVAQILTPQFARNKVEQAVLDAMTWYPADYPLCLEQIVLEETRATLYGYYR